MRLRARRTWFMSMSFRGKPSLSTSESFIPTPCYSSGINKIRMLSKLWKGKLYLPFGESHCTLWSHSQSEFAWRSARALHFAPQCALCSDRSLPPQLTFWRELKDSWLLTRKESWLTVVVAATDRCCWQNCQIMCCCCNVFLLHMALMQQFKSEQQDGTTNIAVGWKSNEKE